jgi:hypothetical protein
MNPKHSASTHCPECAESHDSAGMLSPHADYRHSARSHCAKRVSA